MLQLAEGAAGLWPLDVTHLQMAAHRENAVYRMDTAQGLFALRLHRLGYRSDSELDSELAFMAMLAKNGVTVPAPLASKNGNLVEHFQGTQVSVLTWLPGAPLGETGKPPNVTDRIGVFHRFGALIASLHDAADQWQPPRSFQRQAWDLEGLLGEHPQWGRFWESPYLADDQRAVLTEVRRRLRQDLRSRSFDQGLIHADLVCENILIDDGLIRIIDFDDFGPGFRLQDLATALVKFEAESDFANLRENLFAGYETLRSLDRLGVDLFLFVRHLTYVGWIVPRMQDEASMERCLRFISNAVMKAEVYLGHS